MTKLNAQELKRRVRRLPFSQNLYYGFKTLVNYWPFVADFIKFKKLQKKDGRFQVKWWSQYPQLFDKTSGTSFDPHYLYHPAWAARIIAQNKPKLHVDISSILHFSTLVSAFVPVEFYDYRPADIKLEKLTCKHGDLLNLPFQNDSVESISCMHTIEHVGLGRYGDPLDPQGDLKAIKELKRILAKGGTLLFVTPISGRARIEFNAHRIYTYEQIMGYFSDLTLREYGLIPDNAVEVGLIKNASKEISDEQSWGCGCFWFTK